VLQSIDHSVLPTLYGYHHLCRLNVQSRYGDFSFQAYVSLANEDGKSIRPIIRNESKSTKYKKNDNTKIFVQQDKHYSHVVQLLRCMQLANDEL
jgi:hypothetical protein